MPAMPTSAPFFGSRLPTNRIARNDSPMSSGSSERVLQEERVVGGEGHAQPFIDGDLVEVDVLAVAVEQQDDGEPDADLGGGDGDDEQGEDLPGDGVVGRRRSATRLMLTALRISSIDISTSTPLRRASTPYTPIENRTAPRRRNWLTQHASTPSAPGRWRR